MLIKMKSILFICSKHFATRFCPHWLLFLWMHGLKYCFCDTNLFISNVDPPMLLSCCIMQILHRCIIMPQRLLYNATSLIIVCAVLLYLCYTSDVTVDSACRCNCKFIIPYCYLQFFFCFSNSMKDSLDIGIIWKVFIGEVSRSNRNLRSSWSKSEYSG